MHQQKQKLSEICPWKIEKRIVGIKLAVVQLKYWLVASERESYSRKLIKYMVKSQ